MTITGAPPATPEADPIVIRDVFPALATLVPADQVDPGWPVHRVANRVTRLDVPALAVPRCRAVVTRTRLYLFGHLDGAVTLLYSSPFDPAASTVPALSRPARFITSLCLLDPDMVALVTRDTAAGCGCGSPLRSFAPFTPYRTGPA